MRFHVQNEKGSMRGMNGHERCRAPTGPDCPGVAPARMGMACAALLSCCALAACGSGDDPASAAATTPPSAQPALTVMAGDAARGSTSGGGSVSVVFSSGGTVDVAAGDSSSVAVAAGATATLTAVPADGHAFAGWTLSGGLACAGGLESNPCALAAGSVTADAVVSAVFVALSALTVTAGGGGSVTTEVAGAVTVGADASQGVTVTVLSAATLTATATDGYTFAGWTLSPEGLACANGPAANPCVLEIGSVTADTTVSAAFVALSALTVAAGANGSVEAAVAGTGTVEVGADSSRVFIVSVLSAATLTATAGDGHEFAGWTLSPEGLACANGLAANPCALATGSVTADTTVSATFVALSALTVSAGAGGSVAAEVAGASATEVDADSSQSFTAGIEATATLTAVAAEGHVFAGWTLSTGLACESGARANPCALATGSVTDDASVSATFVRTPATWKGPGSVSMSPDGAVHIAIPYALGAFDRWAGAPCDGSEGLACDVSSVTADEDLPTAVFRPFAIGVKSLAFGLGYHAGAPDHFRVSFQVAQDAGFTPVPSLGRLAPGLGPARLAVSAHLFPWGRGAYLTEACDASDNCVAALGGKQALTRADSTAVTGYFKAPTSTGTYDYDRFGWALALSADGTTLAVGATLEDSSYTGTFAPTDDGYQAALGSNGPSFADGSCYAVSANSCDSGAVTVYRRSGTTWRVEAFVKAPNTGGSETRRLFRSDRFGSALALSADGATLAVGASGENSASTGTFAPTDEGYQAALDSDSASGIGATYIYRRSGSAWSIEAFIKAPRVGVDRFGSAIALSADGATLAVGAPNEDGFATGTFSPTDEGYQAALDNNGRTDSGAAYVYRRSDADRWEIEAFVKAPRLDDGDERFGWALALSADGATLAVGAPFEDSSHTGAFAPGDEGYQAALDSNGPLDRRGVCRYYACDSGAVTVYRRSNVGRWEIEAFVKAPRVGGGDYFGDAIALSADGSALAVGEPRFNGTSTGTFAPGDEGYRAALRGSTAKNIGAVTVYRRSNVGRWEIEAFVKAPVADAGDYFGDAIALSADGATLAVGAPGESGKSTGVFASGDEGYQAALDSSQLDRDGVCDDEIRNNSCNSGAVIVYRRPDGAGAWTVGNFVKAPNADADDYFGRALALSADGATLAVGAYGEGGAALQQPVGGDSADTENAVEGSGAVYLY